MSIVIYVHATGFHGLNHSETRTGERSGGQRTLQSDIATDNSLEECLRDDRRTIGTGMGVVIWEVAVNRSSTKRLETVCDIRKVVDVGNPSISRRRFSVSHESRLGVNKRASFPEVVRSLGGDDHIGTLGYVLLRSRLDIGAKGENRLCNPVIGSAAGFTSRARTVGTSIVTTAQRTTVVVSELNDDPVSRLHNVCDSVESALASV